MAVSLSSSSSSASLMALGVSGGWWFGCLRVARHRCCLRGAPTEGNQCTVEIYRLDRWPMHRCWFALWCTGCVASFASRFPNKSAKDDWTGGREDGGGRETPETRACEANVSKNFSILNFGRMVLKGFLFCFNRKFVKEVVEVEKMKWTAGWWRFLCVFIVDQFNNCKGVERILQLRSFDPLRRL